LGRAVDEAGLAANFRAHAR